MSIYVVMKLLNMRKTAPTYGAGTACNFGPGQKKTKKLLPT